MFNFGYIHSFVIHFTVALFISSVLFDFWGTIKQDSRFHFAAVLNLYFSALAALISVASGILSKNKVPLSETISEKLDLHQNLAFLIVVIILALSLWRIGFRGNFPTNRTGYYLLLGFLGIIVLILGALFGGIVAHTNEFRLK